MTTLQAGWQRPKKKEVVEVRTCSVHSCEEKGAVGVKTTLTGPVTAVSEVVWNLLPHDGGGFEEFCPTHARTYLWSVLDRFHGNE